MRSSVPRQVLSVSRSGALFALARRATAGLAAANVPTWFRLLRGLGWDANLSSQLSNFLASGTEPIVLTQGSTAVHSPGDFYKVSATAAQRLGRRAVLLGMKDGLEVDSPDLLKLPYAPYGQIFPHAVVNVHQGGSGTTGEALRSGRPMLIVPYGWDQP